MPVRRSWYTIRGVKPDCSGDEEFIIETDYVDHLKASGQLDKWRASPVVRDVLANPTSTFRGLKRPENPKRFREGLIYCGKPRECFGEGGTMAPPEGHVLAVYIVFNEDQGGLHAIDWDWKEEDGNCAGCPKSWKLDYGEPIWPPNLKTS